MVMNGYSFFISLTNHTNGGGVYASYVVLDMEHLLHRYAQFLGRPLTDEEQTDTVFTAREGEEHLPAIGVHHAVESPSQFHPFDRSVYIIPFMFGKQQFFHYDSLPNHSILQSTQYS